MQFDFSIKCALILILCIRKSISMQYVNKLLILIDNYDLSTLAIVYLLCRFHI